MCFIPIIGKDYLVDGTLISLNVVRYNLSGVRVENYFVQPDESSWRQIIGARSSMDKLRIELIEIITFLR